jgi:hypothetical protein
VACTKQIDASMQPSVINKQAAQYDETYEAVDVAQLNTSKEICPILKRII